MREGRRGRAESREHLELQAGIGDMILTAHDMGDAHLHIVDDARQHIEPGAILAADHRIAEQGRIEMLWPADQVGPFDRRLMIKLEAPVWAAAFGLEPGPVGDCQRQSGAVINRRLAAAELDLALELQLLRRFPGRIDPARRAQPLERCFIGVEAGGLALLAVDIETEPGEIVADRHHIGLLAPRLIGVVDAQQKATALLAGPKPVVQRRADVADMETAGRRRGEAGGDGHWGERVGRRRPAGKVRGERGRGGWQWRAGLPPRPRSARGGARSACPVLKPRTGTRSSPRPSGKDRARRREHWPLPMPS